MILVNNNQIRFHNRNVRKITEIPVGNWLVMYDKAELEFYLEAMEDFTLPEKMYGDTEKLAERYLNTFNEGSKNLGVVLAGLKGTGKSLLAKALAIQSGLPVIVVSSKFYGSDFNAFLASINAECVVMFDEFEKMYTEEEEQNMLLSVLDGVFTSKKLFVFTSNTTNNYSNYLINRPGRIHYLKQYYRITDDVLNDIVADNLKNQEHAQELKDIINVIEEANIDMVMALIQECNMYNERPKEAVEYLNIKLSKSSYNITVTVEKTGYIYNSHAPYNNNPLLTDKIGLMLYADSETKSKIRKHIRDNSLSDTDAMDYEDDNTSYQLTFRPHETKFRMDERTIIFELDGATVQFEPQRFTRFSF